MRPVELFERTLGIVVLTIGIPLFGLMVYFHYNPLHESEPAQEVVPQISRGTTPCKCMILGAGHHTNSLGLRVDLELLKKSKKNR